MSAAAEILEIPGMRSRVSPVSVADYHRMSEFNSAGRRTELIRGIVLEKMSKSPLHTSIASALFDLFRTQTPDGFWLRKEEPLSLRDSEPEPDISLVVGARTNYATRHPATALLVVEISVTSATDDRALASIYAEAGVGEYWIVMPRERLVEVYRKPVDGIYTEHLSIPANMEVACEAMPSVRVTLENLL